MKARTAAPDPEDRARVVAEIQRYQKECSLLLKSRIMIDNRLVSLVAVYTLGYVPEPRDATAGRPKERAKLFKEAREVIEEYAKGRVDPRLKPYLWAVLDATLPGLEKLANKVRDAEKMLEALASQLPVAAWAKEPAQKGLGLLLLAKIVGECGDLDLYPNPAKLWKRMGCAPHRHNDQTRMGGAWKCGKPGLPAEEWTAYGYNPRRRSLAFVLGDCLVKLNDAGPYRARYDEAKSRYREGHPKARPLHAHFHGNLLAAKLLLKNLWIAWREPPKTRRRKAA